uniref:Band 7 domain-containing protein n=1 Tax=Oryza meridionalis TaxID=40149 RepID=A0A0E0D270_9ORYZ
MFTTSERSLGSYSCEELNLGSSEAMESEMETVVRAGEDNVHSPCSRLDSWGFLGAFEEDAEENILARRLGLVWSTVISATTEMQRWHSVLAPESAMTRQRSDGINATKRIAGRWWRLGSMCIEAIDKYCKMKGIFHFRHHQAFYIKSLKDMLGYTGEEVLFWKQSLHQVVNRLHKEFVHETLLNYGVHYDKTWIYDKIHHEINQFCSAHSLQQVYIDLFDQIDETMKEAIQRDCTRYAPGIEIISVRVTKPNIPDSIRRNFELMEEERTKALIAIEKQKVAEKEAETQKKIALSEAEKNAQVSKILMEQKLMEKDSSKRQQQIDNEMITKEAEANRLKLTPEYLELRFIESIANNSKIFFGEKIPNMIMDQRMLRNYLDNGTNAIRSTIISKFRKGSTSTNGKDRALLDSSLSDRHNTSRVKLSGIELDKTMVIGHTKLGSRHKSSDPQTSRVGFVSVVKPPDFTCD